MDIYEKKLLMDSIVNDYSSLMKGKAFKLTHDEYKAEEITQEAFIRIIKNIEKFAKFNQGQRIAYIVLIIKSVCYDKYKKDMRSDAMEDIKLESHFDPEPDFSQEINKHYTSDAVVKRMEKVIRTLPELDRSMIQMSVSLGLTSVEIGNILGMTKDAAKKRIQRIKKQLHESAEGW